MDTIDANAVTYVVEHDAGVCNVDKVTYPRMDCISDTLPTCHHLTTCNQKVNRVPELIHDILGFPVMEVMSMMTN